MGLWDFVALAVVGGMLLEGYKAYTKSKERSGNSDLEEIEDRLDALEAKLGDPDLEGRVQILETIVTDSKYQLEREIESL